jgi:putative serine protease PepD
MRDQPSAGATTDGQETLDKITSGKSTPDVPAPSAGEGVDWAAVAAKVQSTVVAIRASNVQLGEGGEGSGVIIDSEKGYVVTNNHVVADMDQLSIVMADGRVFEAKVLGADPTTDLAVLQFVSPPDDLVQASLGDSSKLSVGEPVMAVGNPFGYDNTVTTGIVSALNRPVTTSAAGSAAANEQVVSNAIQIDAAVNPGNSGGPLFNAKGEVVGINSSIAADPSSQSSTGTFFGLAFAIPVNVAKVIAPQLVEDGKAVHPLLGVTSNDAEATVSGQTRRGAQVQQVTPGSAAESAGLKAGDVIYAVNDNPISGTYSLTAWIRSLEPGSRVKLSIVRDGKPLDVEATLTEREN